MLVREGILKPAAWTRGLSARIRLFHFVDRNRSWTRRRRRQGRRRSCAAFGLPQPFEISPANDSSGDGIKDLFGVPFGAAQFPHPAPEGDQPLGGVPYDADRSFACFSLATLDQAMLTRCRRGIQVRTQRRIQLPDFACQSVTAGLCRRGIGGLLRQEQHRRNLGAHQVQIIQRGSDHSRHLLGDRGGRHLPGGPGPGLLGGLWLGAGHQGQQRQHQWSDHSHGAEVYRERRAPPVSTPTATLEPCLSWNSTP